MTLPKSIPTLEVNGFSFIKKINFTEYRNRLPNFVGAEGRGSQVAVDAALRIPRVVGFLGELADAQEILTSSLTNSVYATGAEGVGKSALLLALLNKVALQDAAPALLSKSYYIFDQYEFSKLSPAEQVKQFDAAMDYMATKNSMVLLDRLDDFVADAGPDRARRLMKSLLHALGNARVSAFATAQTKNDDSIDQTSTLFSSLFKRLPVEERTSDEAKEILRQMAPYFERRHNVVLGDDAICEIIRLDQRSKGGLKGQSPNRLIEFADQLCASVNNARYGKSIELLKQEMTLVNLLAEEEALKASVKPSAKKLAAVREKIKAAHEIYQPQLDAWTKRFGKIRELRENLLEAEDVLAPLQDKLEKFAEHKKREAELIDAAKAEGKTYSPPEDAPRPLTADEQAERTRWMNTINGKKATASQKEQIGLKAQLLELEKGQYTETPHVTVADVQGKFTKTTGLAAGASNDAERLLSIESVLGRDVFGQDRGKALVANTYRMREAGTSDPTRPAGTILVSGSPGCAKTELFERLAAFDGYELIVYNMSEYTDASSVSKLVGASPGLVGFGEVKTLPSAVKARSKCIVFFDEIEKAHPNMQRAIMQILDKGKMNDEYGDTVYFNNAIIGMATNVLTETMFSGNDRFDDKIVRAQLLEKVSPVTHEKYFLPEFVTRIDAVEVFDDVTPAIAELILRKNIRDINKGISARGYEIGMDDAVAKAIVEEFFDPSQGGRSIKQLSNKILRPLTTQRVLTRQAAEVRDEDDELRPMLLRFDNRLITIDGVPLMANNSAPEESGPDRPPAVPPALFPKAAAENASLAGGQR